MNLARINTRQDQKYFEKSEKVLKAHSEGKLGRNWYTKNQKTGKLELKPKRLSKYL